MDYPTLGSPSYQLVDVTIGTPVTVTIIAPTSCQGLPITRTFLGDTTIPSFVTWADNGADKDVTINPTLLSEAGFYYVKIRNTIDAYPATYADNVLAI